MQKTVLVVGGTSGLGECLADRFESELGYRVVVAGRTMRRAERPFCWVNFGSCTRPLVEHVESVLGLHGLDRGIDCFIYAAGVPEDGRIDELSDEHEQEQFDTGLRAPHMFLSRIMKRQGKLDGLITIGSTSEQTARLREPLYCMVKSGLVGYARSLALDERFGRIVHAAVAGMKTTFLERLGRDTTEMLDPDWVAGKILEEWSAPAFKHSHMLFARKPAPDAKVTELKWPA